jgi:CheY-like chemotaxis protein
MANDKQQKRILYVEASDLPHQSFGVVMEKLNCSVRSVASAQEAIEELSSDEPFDVILLGDIAKLTDDDYVQTQLSLIRKARSLQPEIPILLFASFLDIRLAYETGVTSHLVKPAGANALTEFLTPYLM